MTPDLSYWHRTRRRPSFWLGLFVACFLGWAWRDSYSHLTTVRLDLDFREVGFVRIEGRTWFPAMTMGAEKIGLAFMHKDLASFPESEPLEPGGIPDSLVFFSVVGLWVGWLAFSEWRRKTRSNSSA